VVFCNCTEQEKSEIEKVQLAAARVVLGATRGTSHAKMYQELGWLTLETRRKNQMLKTYFNIMRDKRMPDSIRNMIPDKVAQRTTHNVRSKEKLCQPRARTVTYQESFIPATTREWNLLPPEAQSTTTLEAFKEYLQKPSKPPDYVYFCVSRKAQVLHNRLRLGCSGLKQHLYLKNICDSPICDCGREEETPIHFLLVCENYDDIREELYTATREYRERPAEILLEGSNELSCDQNQTIFAAVQKFIIKSERFN
jgi:hypothetical protein